MPQINEAPENFVPDVTITIQVPPNSELKTAKQIGAFCTVDGEITKRQWCNIFSGFGEMVANLFSGEFDEFLKSQEPMSDKEKRVAYAHFCQLQMLHMFGHLQEGFEEVGKEYLESMGLPKDMQA